MKGMRSVNCSGLGQLVGIKKEGADQKNIT